VEAESRESRLGDLPELRIDFATLAPYGMGVMLSGRGTRNWQEAIRAGARWYEGQFMQKPDVLAVDHAILDDMRAGEVGAGIELVGAQLPSPDHLFIGHSKPASRQEGP